MIKCVPIPKQYDIKDEAWHSLAAAICTDVPEWARYAETFAETFAKAHGKALSVGESGGIVLVKNPALADKTYTLDTVGNAAVLAASGAEGILYALATALQLISVREGVLRVQSLTVTDYPDKDFRAAMVDLSRCWHPFDKLLKFVDLCFLYKVKYLHLHFIDDGFYTLPSRVFPKLPSEGHHYSFAEIEQLRVYAADRGVVLIPEIECPGHAFSINRAYPEVFANRIEGEASVLYNESGEAYANDALLCAGSARAFEGLQALITEVVELFPEAPYIHLGGDEANIELWNNCPACRAYMQEQGIADVQELYSDYIGRACAFVLSLGKTPIVWEGFPQKGCERVPRETVVIAWESHYHLAPDLLAAGFRIINASWQPLYIVDSLSRRWSPEDIWHWNVYNWQHWWPHSKAYLNPINVQPSDQVLGAQLSVWECTFEQEFGRTLENLSALSERTWTVERLHEDAAFFVRAKPTLLRIARFVQNV